MSARRRPRTPPRLTLAQRQSLARRLAPVLVLFPEREALGPPKGGHAPLLETRGDYHPRAVDLVLDHAHVYTGLRGALAAPRSLAHLDQGHPAIRALPSALRRRLPEAPPDANERLPDVLRGPPDLALGAVMDLIGIGRDREACKVAWRKYFAALGNDDEDRYRRTVYARVLQGDEAVRWTLKDRLLWYTQVLKTVDEVVADSPRPVQRLAAGLEQLFERLEGAVHELVNDASAADEDPRAVIVEYWFLYFYNDWKNRHEVDWEGISLLLEGAAGAEDLTDVWPVSAGYASHVRGRRRPWCDVETEGSHPVVYVALGSHASYFRYRPEGYAAGIPVSVRIPGINAMVSSEIQRPGVRGHRDWVPDPTRAPDAAAILTPGKDYDVRLLPNLDPRRHQFAAADFDSLSWLFFPGLWGDRPLLSVGGSGPRGPLWHGRRSDDPFSWVRGCTPDDDYSG